MVKLCTNLSEVEQSPAEFIDYLAFFKGGGAHFQTLLLRVGWTKLQKICGEQSSIIAAPNTIVRYRFEMKAVKRRVVPKIGAKVHTL